MTEPFFPAKPGDTIKSSEWNELQSRLRGEVRSHTHSGGEQGSKLSGDSIAHDAALRVKQLSTTTLAVGAEAHFTVNGAGRVGIGVADPGEDSLRVAGVVRATEVSAAIVTTQSLGCDGVLEVTSPIAVTGAALLRGPTAVVGDLSLGRPWGDGGLSSVKVGKSDGHGGWGAGAAYIEFSDSEEDGANKGTSVAIGAHTWGGGTAEAMRIAANRCVGIGTSTPSEMLDVEGNIRATGSLGASSLVATGPVKAATLDVSGPVKAATLDVLEGVRAATLDVSDALSAASIVASSSVHTATLSASERVQAAALDLDGPLRIAAPKGDGNVETTIATRMIPEGQGQGNERSELIIFHGNDGLNGAGPDAITLRAPAIRLQTYDDAEVLNIGNTAGSNDRLLISPAGAVTVVGDLSVGGEVRLDGVLDIGSSLAVGSELRVGGSAQVGGRMSVTGDLALGRLWGDGGVSSVRVGKGDGAGDWGAGAAFIEFSDSEEEGVNKGTSVAIAAHTWGGGTAEAMRIAANRCVGIGTSVPSEKLDVAGNIRATGSVRAASLDVSGSVLAAALDLQGPLHIAAPKGDGNVDTTIATRMIPEGQGQGNERSELIIFHGNDGSNGAGPDTITLRAPAIRLQTYDDGGVLDIANSAGSNDRLRISPAGEVTVVGELSVGGEVRLHEGLNVGGALKVVGAAQVEAAMAVAGDLTIGRLWGDGGASSVKVGKGDPAGSWGAGAAFIEFSDSEEDGINKGTSVAIAAHTWGGGTAEAMRIAANRCVGIGTSAPSEKLEVAGNIKATGSVGAASIDVSGLVHAATLRASGELHGATLHAVNSVLTTTLVADRFEIKDNRSSEPTPASYQKAMHLEFKESAAIGLGGGGAYAAVLTMAPWYDSSGGPVHQLAFSDTGVFHRLGAQNGDWQPWRALSMTL